MLEDPQAEALRWALRQIEHEVGPVSGGRERIAGTAPGWRLKLHVAGVGPVFAKIADGGDSSRLAIGAEAALLTTVRHRHMPHVVAADPTSDVPWMLLTDMSDAQWPPPWPDEAGLNRLWKAMRRISRVQPPGWLTQPSDIDPWQTLLARDDEGAPDDNWWREHAEALAAAATVTIAGTDLVHGDLGSGNLCWDSGRPVLVDWSDAYVGNAEMDMVTVAIDIAHSDGRRVQPPVANLPAWLAKIAGLLVSASLRPAWPGLGGQQVRDEQQALARTAVRWAVETQPAPHSPNPLHSPNSPQSPNSTH
ncbi:MAG: phosphotransferase [Euzebya sp.]